MTLEKDINEMEDDQLDAVKNVPEISKEEQLLQKLK